MDAGVIFVAPNEENADDEGCEIPLEDNGTCLLKTVQSQFSTAMSLRYRAPDTGRWRALKIDNGIIYPPADGWGDLTYIAVPDKKRTREDEIKVDSEIPKAATSDKVGDLIILGLNYKATEEDVKDYFSKYGDILSCEVKKDFDGNSRGFGFISFEKDEIARQVLKSTYHTIAGRKCEIRIPKRTEPERKLFVGRLPRGTTEADLTEYFSAFGALADVYIPKPHRGFAFVTFEKGEEAEVVLRQRHFLKDSPLNVTIPDPPAKKQKFGEGDGSRAGSKFDVYGQGRDSRFYGQHSSYHYINPQGSYGYQPGYPASADPKSSQTYQQAQSVPTYTAQHGVGYEDGRGPFNELEIGILDSLVKKIKGDRSGTITQWS